VGRGVRDEVLALVRESVGPLGFEPWVIFEGPVDTIVDEQTAVELLATLREALSNIARHAGAGRVDIGPAPQGGTLVVWKVPAPRSDG